MIFFMLDSIHKAFTVVVNTVCQHFLFVPYHCLKKAAIHDQIPSDSVGHCSVYVHDICLM